jgi:hypothetical protein
MFDRKAGKFPTRIIMVVLDAKQSREEGLRNCFLDVCELLTYTLLDSLNKLPLLLERLLQAGVGSLWEVFGHHSELCDRFRPTLCFLLDPVVEGYFLTYKTAEVPASRKVSLLPRVIIVPLVMFYHGKPPRPRSDRSLKSHAWSL